MANCICNNSPRVVDLTCDGAFNDDAKSKLLENMKRFGWSPVRMKSESSDTGWKEKIVAMFDQEDVQLAKDKTNETVYRSAESGAPGTVEPKESWETMRCTCCKRMQTENQIEQMLRGWASMMHGVAIAVRKAMDLPEGVLLQEKPCKKDQVTSCSMDLIRSFYYEIVPQGVHALGSNAHTDWGSLTIVWQDDVGGLQAYCKPCRRWVDVSPIGSSTSPVSGGGCQCIDFIVHLGDVSSLSFGHALQSFQTCEVDAAQAVSTPWPSPLHRVRSPSVRRRASLVYFAYPPSGRTLNSISQDLVKWRYLVDDSCKDNVSFVPYGDYYLLRNQSMHADKLQSSAEARFTQIERTAIEKVIAEKWSQVQRFGSSKSSVSSLE